jgi:hypothetical protein
LWIDSGRDMKKLPGKPDFIVDKHGNVQDVRLRQSLIEVEPARPQEKNLKSLNMAFRYYLLLSKSVAQVDDLQLLVIW